MKPNARFRQCSAAEGPIARFHFHFRNGATLERDEEGIEFASFEEACANAYAAIPHLWWDLQREGKQPFLCAFEITDGDNRLLLDLPFFEGMNPKNYQPPAPIAARRRFVEWQKMLRLSAELNLELRRARENMAASRALLKRLSNALVR